MDPSYVKILKSQEFCSVPNGTVQELWDAVGIAPETYNATTVEEELVNGLADRRSRPKLENDEAVQKQANQFVVDLMVDLLSDIRSAKKLGRLRAEASMPVFNEEKEAAARAVRIVSAAITDLGYEEPRTERALNKPSSRSEVKRGINTGWLFKITLKLVSE